MTITPYQIIVPIAAFVALLYAWNLFYKGKKTLWETSIWTLFWGSIATIAIFPDLVSYLSHATGVQDRENAVFATAIGILSFAVFYLVIRLEDMQRRVTRIVGKMALKDLDTTPQDESEDGVTE